MECSAPECLLRLCHRSVLACALCIGWAAGSQDLAAQELPFPSDHHPWAGFPVGSWKTVRTITETFDTQGKIDTIATTDTKTTLVGVGEASYSLRIETTIETAGRQLATPPQIVKHGMYGETPGQMVGVQRTGEAQLSVDGRNIPCELRQVVTEADGVKRTSVLHYSDKVAPYVLRRETTGVAGADMTPQSTLVEVVSLSLPLRVYDDLQNAIYVKTTNKDATATRVTLEAHLVDVPGWVVAHWFSERDVSGRVMRRSTLELREFGFPDEPADNEDATASPRSRRLQRKAERRAMRQGPAGQP